MINKDVLLKRVGLAILISVISMLAIVTVEVFLFSAKPLGTATPPITNSPEEQLSHTETGQELIRIRQLANSAPLKAQQAIDTISTESLTVIENIYLQLALRDIAREQKLITIVQKRTQSLSRLAAQHDVFWLQSLLKVEQAEQLLTSGNINAGIREINDAIDIAELHRAEFVLLRAYNAAGALYNASNQLKTSQFYFYKGLELGKNHPNNKYNGLFYNNLGLLYIHLEQWSPALEYLKQAYRIFNADENTRNERLLVVLFNQSYVYSKLNDAANARSTYQAALKYVNDNSRDYYQILKLKVEARLLLLEDNYQQAVEIALQCQRFPAIEEFPKQKAICLYTLAKSLMALGHYPEAMDYLKSSIQIFTHIDHQRWLIRAYLVKAEIYELQGDPIQALRIYKEYNAKERKQFFNEIYGLEFAFDTHEVQQERDFLNIQNELKAHQIGKERLHFRILAIWVAIGLLVLVLVIRRTLHVSNQNLELQNLSYLDPLTGLNNRRFYQNEIESGSLLDKKSEYRVVLIDLDWFKRINDQYGHDIGDDVLVITSERLKAVIDSDELLIRWGGEEFLCLLKESHDLKSRVESLLTRINGDVYSTSAGILTVTISVGVSKPNSIVSLRSDSSPFVEADKCLYQSKQNGRNQATYSR